jgi:hypothetical protein
MDDTIENIEGRRVERSDIVLVEPLPPSEVTPTSGKIFRARVVRLAGRSFLIQMTPQDFAKQHNVRLISTEDPNTNDNIAINPDLADAKKFDVEAFAATDTFRPAWAFQTRLI